MDMCFSRSLSDLILLPRPSRLHFFDLHKSLTFVFDIGWRRLVGLDDDLQHTHTHTTHDTPTTVIYRQTAVI